MDSYSTDRSRTFSSDDIHVVGSTGQIFLYSFAGGDILIGSTEAPAAVDINNPATLDGTKIVFAYYLQENATHTGADVWGVTFQPLDHPIAGTSTAAHDDPIDFADFLHVTASASLSFNFDKLQSGSFPLGRGRQLRRPACWSPASTRTWTPPGRRPTTAT